MDSSSAAAAGRPSSSSAAAAAGLCISSYRAYFGLASSSLVWFEIKEFAFLRWSLRELKSGTTPTKFGPNSSSIGPQLQLKFAISGQIPVISALAR